MTIANASKEAADKKENSQLARIPFWRTLKSNGFLNEKYPGGPEAHKKLLEKEGFKIISRGKKYQVAEYKKYIAQV